MTGPDAGQPGVQHTAAAHPPATEQDLDADIIRTRAELSDTVAQLAAKADVKGRAQRAATGMLEQAKGRYRVQLLAVGALAVVVLAAVARKLRH
jgi:Protein of unknown function (DUF3618)